MSRYHFDDEDEPVVVIEKHASGITPFLVGLGIGAVAALLLAPRSGAATRRDIRRRANRVRRAAERAVTDAKDGVVGTFEDAKRAVEERIDTVRDAIDLKKRQVSRAMEAGRAAARDARQDLEGRLNETKAAYNAGAAVAREGRATAGEADGE